MEVQPNERIEKRIENITEHDQKAAKGLESLPDSIEGYEALDLYDRMDMATQLLSRYSHTVRANDLPDKRAFTFEADLTDHEGITVTCYVGYQPHETSPGYGDTTYTTRTKQIGVCLVLSSQKTGYEEKLPRQRLEFDWHYEDGRKVRELKIPMLIGEKRPLDASEDAQLIEIIDEASHRLIEEKLAQERQQLGAVTITGNTT